MSRPNRRAQKRLEQKLEKYERMKAADRVNGGKGFTKPGALNKW